MRDEAGNLMGDRVWNLLRVGGEELCGVWILLEDGVRNLLRDGWGDGEFVGKRCGESAGRQVE